MSPIKPPVRLEECRTLEDRLLVFQYYSRIADPYPIAKWLGVEYIPPSFPDGIDLSEEWLHHCLHAAGWIRRMYERLYQPNCVDA